MAQKVVLEVHQYQTIPMFHFFLVLKLVVRHYPNLQVGQYQHSVLVRMFLYLPGKFNLIFLISIPASSLVSLRAQSSKDSI
jgi:hypothetical protein